MSKTEKKLTGKEGDIQIVEALFTEMTRQWGNAQDSYFNDLFGKKNQIINNIKNDFPVFTGIFVEQATHEQSHNEITRLRLALDSAKKHDIRELKAKQAELRLKAEQLQAEAESTQQQLEALTEVVEGNAVFQV
jgi:hypothetical protein